MEREIDKEIEEREIVEREVDKEIEEREGNMN